MNCPKCNFKLVVHAVSEEPIGYDDQGNSIEEVLGMCDICMCTFLWKRKAVFVEYDIESRTAKHG